MSDWTPVWNFVLSKSLLNIGWTPVSNFVFSKSLLNICWSKILFYFSIEEFSLVSLKTVWKTELLCCNLPKPRQWICWFWNGFTWYVLHTLIKWCMFFLFNLLLFIYEIYQNEICKLFSCIGDSYVWNVLYDDFNWIQMLPKTLVSIMFALKGSIVVHVVIFSFIIVFNYLFSF